MKPTGYMVIECCEEFEQILMLEKGKSMPKDGILNWPDKEPRAIFASRAEAQAAINRTEHFRLAFDISFPEKKFCKVVPVATVGAIK